LKRIIGTVSLDENLEQWSDLSIVETSSLSTTKAFNNNRTPGGITQSEDTACTSETEQSKQYELDRPPIAATDQDPKVLRISRDHIGSISVYWRREGNKLFFSSNLVELIKVDAGTLELSMQSIASFLASPDAPPQSGTFFTKIKSVQPGCVDEIRPCGSVQTRRWWDPPVGVNPNFPNPSDYVEATRALIEQAIGREIKGARKVGAHISGGIDSTGIGVIANRQLRERGDILAGVYTWSPEISEFHPMMGSRDERDRVRVAAGDAPVRYGRGDEHNLLAFLERPMEFEGVADLADEVPLLELAAGDGVDVMLSGWGGDEAFSAHGFGYIAHLLLSLQWPRAMRFARSQLRTLRRFKPLASLMWEQGLYPLLPKSIYDRLDPYRNHYRNKCFMSEDLKHAFQHEIAARREPVKFGANIGENIKKQLNCGHIGMRMETWANWAQPHGFVYRYPLTDRRLLEFIISIPPEVLFMNDRPRGLALEVLKDVLPSNVMKHDFANERLRESTRNKAWALIAEKVKRGEWLAQDCPWLDMHALRTAALTPKPQKGAENIFEFAELFSALRVWHMYQRSLLPGYPHCLLT
jgi:asparagine synthase (glutamine-hydrolysing)